MKKLISLTRFKSSLACIILLFALSFSLRATVTLPSIFSDHMVLQQKQSNPVWGWAPAGEVVKIQINGQSHAVEANAEGRWDVKLNPIPAGGPYQMRIEGADHSFQLRDILVGEVWICSGQSNMAWTVNNSNAAELELLTANFPNIRLISVPQVGTQDAHNDFKGAWARCTAEEVKDFSAIGFFFGRRLHQALNVPIGLIDNAWGGSAAEAWIKRDVLEKEGQYNELLTWWEDQEQNFDYDQALAEWAIKLSDWQEAGSLGNKPRRPNNLMRGNQRPANIYNGVLHPTIGYGIRGAIWYQGESNASRAHQYRDLFPLMIEHWREEWGQGNFPFYYVQLADFMDEETEPAESAWAELREAQTMTMSRLPNVGEAVIIDVGEGRDIHPRNKQVVANRLARWALARDYGKTIQFRSPTFRSVEKEGNKMILTFNQVGQGLYAFDKRQPLGFTIAGDDKKFVHAEAEIIGANQIAVWSEAVSSPVSVRYAWANNPVCNMYSRDGLPMTPFRTDAWPGVTDGKKSR